MGLGVLGLGGHGLEQGLPALPEEEVLLAEVGELEPGLGVLLPGLLGPRRILREGVLRGLLPGAERREEAERGQDGGRLHHGAAGGS